MLERYFPWAHQCRLSLNKFDHSPVSIIQENAPVGTQNHFIAQRIDPTTPRKSTNHIDIRHHVSGKAEGLNSSFPPLAALRRVAFRLPGRDAVCPTRWFCWQKLAEKFNNRLLFCSLANNSRWPLRDSVTIHISERFQQLLHFFLDQVRLRASHGMRWTLPSLIIMLDLQVFSSGWKIKIQLLH